MHDEFFKYNLKRREILIEILKMSLSEDFFDIINSSRIESEKTDFITERLEKHQGDALFKALEKKIKTLQENSYQSIPI